MFIWEPDERVVQIIVTSIHLTSRKSLKHQADKLLLILNNLIITDSFV